MAEVLEKVDLNKTFIHILKRPVSIIIICDHLTRGRLDLADPSTLYSEHANLKSRVMV